MVRGLDPKSFQSPGGGVLRPLRGLGAVGAPGGHAGGEEAARAQQRGPAGALGLRAQWPQGAQYLRQEGGATDSKEDLWELVKVEGEKSLRWALYTRLVSEK